MAKNWNVREFAEAVMNGGDAKKEAVADAGKRFPLTANLVSAIMATNAKEDFKDFASALPDWVTMRKVEAVLKDGVNAPSEDETEEAEAEEEKPAKKEKKPRAKKEKVEEAEVEAEEEEAEEAPKKAKKAKKEKEEKPAKKTKAPKKVKEEEPEEEEEEEDEWEI